jgi:hypothetical protein
MVSLMKKKMLSISILFGISIISLNAQVLKSIEVEIPGTLATLLTEGERDSITHLTVTGSINNADYEAMKAMPALTGIDLGSVTTAGDSIPAYAFGVNITSLVLPTSITLMGRLAMVGSNSLTSLIIPPLVTKLGYACFGGCSGLTSVTLPESLTTISSFAFAGCQGLKTLTIPESVDSIAPNTFVSCTSLQSVSLPSSLRRIEEYTFIDCRSLAGLVIPSSVKSIGRYAFISTGLRTISLPPSIDSVAMYTFTNCDSLVSATLPSSITSVGPFAFVSCDRLDSVTFLPSSGAVIKAYAFAGCIHLRTIIIHPSSGTEIKQNAFAGCQEISNLIFYSPSVTSIPDYTFNYLAGLTSLVLPSSLTSIGKNCFQYCNNLKSVAFQKDSETSIGEYSFLDCPALDTITMPPGSIKSFGRYCFSRCPMLKSLSLPLSISYLEQDIFSQNPGLLSLTLPSSVSNVNTGDFNYATGLQTIRANRIEPPIVNPYYSVFWGVNTTTCMLKVPAGSAEAYATAYRWRDFTHIVEYDLLLSLSQDTLWVADTSGSTVSFDISSTTEWGISSDESWLNIRDTLGMDDGTIILTADENPDITERTALISVSGMGVASQTLVVTQAPKPALSVSTDNLSLGAEEGSTITFDITSNTSWVVNSDQSWLVPGPLSGTGNASITLTAGANTSNTGREAIITVSGNRVTAQTIAITQEANIPSGLESVSAVPVRAYPNPVKDLLYIEGAVGNTVEVYNAQGQFIFSKQSGNNLTTLDMSVLPFGLYLIRVNGEIIMVTK